MPEMPLPQPKEMILGIALLIAAAGGVVGLAEATKTGAASCSCLSLSSSVGQAVSMPAIDASFWRAAAGSC